MPNIMNIIQSLSVIVIPLLFAITLHEAAHGYIANKLGDKTALMLGRVTLNPVKHIDLFGTIILPIVMLLMKTGFIFGWAKPVPVTWQNLKHPRRDMALVAIAGPAANLLMAFIWALVVKLSLMLTANWDHSTLLLDISAYGVAAGNFGIIINMVLLILNMLPIPPLDGSRIVSAILPPRLAARYEILEPYGIWILLGLLLFGFLQKIIIYPLILFTSWIIILFNLPVNPLFG